MAEPVVLTPSAAFGLSIREQRRERGISQQQVCGTLAELGVKMHQTKLARIETGKQPVSLDEAFYLAAAVGVSPLFLMSGALLRGREQPEIAVTPSPESAWSPLDVLKWFRGQKGVLARHDRAYHTQVPDDEWAAKRKMLAVPEDWDAIREASREELA